MTEKYTYKHCTAENDLLFCFNVLFLFYIYISHKILKTDKIVWNKLAYAI